MRKIFKRERGIKLKMSIGFQNGSLKFKQVDETEVSKPELANEWSSYSGNHEGIVEIHALNKLDLPLYFMDKISCEDDGLYCWTCSIRKKRQKENQ